MLLCDNIVVKTENTAVALKVTKMNCLYSRLSLVIDLISLVTGHLVSLGFWHILNYTQTCLYVPMVFSHLPDISDS